MNGMIYTPEQIAAIKELANANIVIVLTALELYDNMKDKYPKYINGRCPIHNGDNNTGFSWDYEKGIFKCWTKQCHTAGNDVYGLVEQLLGLSFTESIEWIIDAVKIDLEKLQISQGVVENIPFIRNTKKNVGNEDKIIEDKIFTQLEDATDYVIKERGFSKAVISIFEPRFGKDNIIENMGNRVAFPIRNMDGKIIGCTGRRIDDKMKIPKWLHNFDKMNHLYGFYQAKKYIKETGVIILVEGVYDTIAFWNAGIKNVVAILGIELGGPQRSLIWSSGAFTAILAFDKDEAGERANKKIKQELEKYLSIEEFEITNGGKDVCEMSGEKIKQEYNKIKNLI